MSLVSSFCVTVYKTATVKLPYSIRVFLWNAWRSHRYAWHDRIQDLVIKIEISLDLRYFVFYRFYLMPHCLGDLNVYYLRMYSNAKAYALINRSISIRPIIMTFGVKWHRDLS